MAKKKSSAVATFLLGCAFFFGAFPMLFWNEGRSLHRIMTLAEGRNVVVSEVSPNAVSPDNQNKLVHLQAFADTDEQLQDPLFNVQVNNALKLVRKVEMYQWDEENSSDRDAIASYRREWSESRINSDNFDDSSKRNPPLPYRSQTTTPEIVRFGAFRLNEALVGMINNYEKIDVGDFFAELPPEMQGKSTIHDGGFYQGTDPNSPAIGDVRVMFSVARPTTASVIAEQTGETFQRYDAKTVRGNIQRLEVGEHSADEMFTKMETENKILTWLLRFGGTFMMFMGGMMVLDPLLRLLSWVPLGGRIATSLISMIVGLAAIGLSATTIGVAWLFYRPLLSIALFAVAAALAYGVRMLLRKKKDTEVIDDARIQVVE